MKRIHIVGCSPRSGTTLLAEAMINCFEIDLHESHEASIFQHPPREGNIYLTKRPRDICVIRPVLMIDPDLYVIYMLRDPRNIICSKHGGDPEHYWAGLNYWNAFTPYSRKLKGHERFITIRYEDLVSSPDNIQTVLMKRMPFLVKKTPFSDYHKVAQPSQQSIKALRGVRPISAAGTGNWRNHLPRVAGQLLLHGTRPLVDDLIEYGYETDDAWMKELRGIRPDTNPSHRVDKFDRKSLRKLRGHLIRDLTTLLFRRAFQTMRNRLIKKV